MKLFYFSAAAFAALALLSLPDFFVAALALAIGVVTIVLGRLIHPQRDKLLFGEWPVGFGPGKSSKLRLFMTLDK
jgi:hypothetical protein